jgi:hypothetical protein
MFIAACAVRLGGPSAEEYNAMTFAAAANESAEQAAARITAGEAELVLLSAQRDTSWFEAVAQATSLTLSGPGSTGPTALAFFGNLEILGDTSLVLNVPEGGRIHMHDALYKVDKERFLDLMMVRFDSTVDLRASVRTLFGYIATDVGASAALLLAIEAATPGAADSAATLMRATFERAVACGESDGNATAQPQIQLLYGPSARMSCNTARVVTGATNAIIARIVVER